MPAEVVVVGAGGAGGTLAGLIATGRSRNVLLCDADEEHRTAIKRHGLVLSTRTANRRLAIDAVAPCELPSGLRTVVLAVRGADVRAAMEALVPALHPDGVVLAVQDGVSFDTVAAAIGEERTLGTVCGFSAHRVAPGHVVVERDGSIAVGIPESARAGMASAVAALIPGAATTDTVASQAWARRIHLCFLLAADIAGMRPSDVLSAERFQPLLRSLAEEIAAQCPVPHVPFDGVDPGNIDASIGRLRTEWAVADSLRPGGDCGRRSPIDVAAFAGLDGAMFEQLRRLSAAVSAGSRSRTPANLDLLATYERCRSEGERLRAVTQLLQLADADPPAGPLCGVPVGLKDNIDVAGVPTTNGSGALSRPARSHAAVVKRLLDAGAEPVCKTNMLEFAIGNPSRTFGGTRNPVDVARTSGGSSGGSAALVGAGALDYAVGTDTTGSVLVPASYCGIVGLKPTHGTVPMDGVTALAPTCDHVGTLTRTAQQALRLLGVLSGRPVRLRDVRTLRIGLLTEHVTDEALTGPVRQAMSEQAEAFSRLPVEIAEISIPELALVDEAVSAIVLHEADEHLHSLLTVPGLADGTRLFLEHAVRCGPDRYRRGLAARKRVMAAFDRAFAEVDVLAGPTVFRTAPSGDALYTTPEDDLESRFTGAYSITGNPAVTVPCAVDPDGLPIGLLLGGPPHTDDRLLSFADLYERQVLVPGFGDSPATRQSSMEVT
jgi:Asp-tRNA(Asn)/Glu-tRNA(Gln) amidotransferase A subunit family amidase/ketopantoate reductase